VKAAYAAIPTFAKLLAGESVKGMVEALLERSANVVGGDATRYSGETYWHVDVQQWILPIVKFVIYLDPIDGHNIFSYLPCSQHFPEGSRAPEQLSRIVQRVSLPECPVHEIAFRGGDAIVFNPRVAHAVLSKTARRQLAVLFASVPRNAVEAADLKQLLMMNAMVA
jgi:hypothetical protein